ALDQYQLVLALEPNTAPALTAAGRLQESLGDPEAAAESFKKLIPHAEGEAKLEAGRRRADLLLQLEDTKAAIAAYKLVLGLDPDDYEVVEILRDLSESSENWTDYVKFQQQLIEVEGDENDAASMAQKLAHALSEKLARPKDAM